MRYLVVIFFLLFLLGACSPRLTPTPTPSSLPSVTRTQTATITRTPPPTWTFVPTITPTPTLTFTFTFTPTPSETPALLAPAMLFPFNDADGRVIDWGYAHLSDYTKNEHGTPVTLSGFLAFQLMDRAIHHETITFDAQTLTVYYLNVQHAFNGKLIPTKLILSAAAGPDVPLSHNPAGGGAYVRLRILPLWDSFDAPQSHLDANKPYTDYHSQFYPDVLLVNLQALLPALPAEMIVLAESQIIFDLDRQGYQVKYNLDTVPYLAARFMPFLALDDYDRVTGPSPEAANLVDYLINQIPIPGGIPYFSSDILVLIPRTGQIPTLP